MINFHERILPTSGIDSYHPQLSLMECQDSVSDICSRYIGRSFLFHLGRSVGGGRYFIVNKYVLRCPIQVERPPIINMCTPKTLGIFGQYKRLEYK